MDAFAKLQREKLVAGWRADLPESTTPNVLIALPSYSVDRSTYEHYGDRVPALENRFLYAVLAARRPTTRVVYLSSLPVRDEILDGYLDLLGGNITGRREDVLSGSWILSPEDTSARSLAEKLLDRGDLIDALRSFIGDHPALIEPWNVTEAEAAFAVAIGAPLYGTAPSLRTVATKSNGRRLFRDAGVPVPPGSEDVRSPAEVTTAVKRLVAANPPLHSVVVKLDDSVAGDGNIVVPVSVADDVADVLPDWFAAVLEGGGVVEERIVGEDFRSPSAQATITPMGDVVVLATHEQRLGGPDGQVFHGCSFPADADYAALLGEYTVRTGRELAKLGACGRFAVDFVVCRASGGGSSGSSEWDVHALEINLRKGGTTHPYGITRLLAGGGYDAASGTYLDAAGRPTFYGATDNLLDERWIGRPPLDVRRAIADAGLAFDHQTGVGVVPHLLDCLAVDGRMGYTAIASSPEQLAAIEERILEALALEL